MKFCSNCGTRLEDDDLFCSGCGSRQEAAPVAPPVAPPAPACETPPVVRPAQGTYRTAPTQKPKKKKKGLLIGIIIAAAVLLLAGALVICWAIGLFGGSGDASEKEPDPRDELTEFHFQGLDIYLADGFEVVSADTSFAEYSNGDMDVTVSYTNSSTDYIPSDTTGSSSEHAYGERNGVSYTEIQDLSWDDVEGVYWYVFYIQSVYEKDDEKWIVKAYYTDDNKDEAIDYVTLCQISKGGSGSAEPGKPTSATTAPAPEVTEPYYPYEPDEPSAQAITLKVWTASGDQAEGGWLEQMLDKFEEAHPEYEITWDLGICGEGDAGGNVTADPAAAADVYFFANDQMGALYEAGALAKLRGSYKEQVLNDNTAMLISSVTYTDGEIYGFPTTNNTWFMYYNKQYLTEEDIKSLDTMVSKGVVAFPLSTAWYNAAFILGNGGTIFGENGLDASAGFDFGGQKGYEATKKVVELVNTKNFVDDPNTVVGPACLKDGTIGACFSGDWMYADLKAALGDDLGVATLPTFDIDGRAVQLKSFAGSKCVGVNPNCKNQKAAMQLASFLASEEAQLARYEIRGTIPCHKDLAESETIKNDEVAVVQIYTMNNTSILQPALPAMSRFWSPMGAYGSSLANGEITLDNYKDQLDLVVDQLNAEGL